MEPIRREALIQAAIAEIGAAGSVNVPVSRIAQRAGVSPALAHHYFGSKEQIFIAAMRRILDDFGASIRRRYASAHTPHARLVAIIEACFEPDQFDPAIISAWLAFYVEAARSPQAARLLRIYGRRLDSNLVYALRQLMPECPARGTAEILASMIDGFYIRAALQDRILERRNVTALVIDYLDQTIRHVENAA